MLTDTRLRHLKPKEKLYKVNDRDGLYVAVTPAGTISFRYNYSINGRQETVTFGRYGVGGISLAEARERLNEAKKMVAGGRSPAREKARDKARIKDAETFGAWAEKWLRGYQMAESTRDMRRSVYQRELKAKFAQQKLSEITHEDLRALTDNIVERGAPATAVHAREIVLQVYRWAIERGQKVENPADLVRPASIAKFEPRDRALTSVEIGLMERVGTTPSIRAAVKLLLLTMVRKSELTNATWNEINFSEALWTIPKERMKRRNHFKSMFVMLVASIILLVLVNKVPPMMGNIPGGASMGGVGGFGSGALMGAAGSASAVITTVSGALVSGGGLEAPLPLRLHLNLYKLP